MNDFIKWRNMENLSFPFSHVYKPHNIPVMYKDEPIYLTPEQEQIWNAYAVTTIPVAYKQPVLNYLNKVMEGVVEIDDLERVDVSEIKKHLGEKARRENKRYAIVQDRIQLLSWSNPSRVTFQMKNGEIELPVGNGLLLLLLLLLLLMEDYMSY